MRSVLLSLAERGPLAPLLGDQACTYVLWTGTLRDRLTGRLGADVARRQGRSVRPCVGGWLVEPVEAVLEEATDWLAERCVALGLSGFAAQDRGGGQASRLFHPHNHGYGCGDAGAWEALRCDWVRRYGWAQVRSLDALADRAAASAYVGKVAHYAAHLDSGVLPGDRWKLRGLWDFCPSGAKRW